MKLMLDQGLPRSAAALLREKGHDAVHVAEIGLAAATDAEILAEAESQRKSLTHESAKRRATSSFASRNAARSFCVTFGVMAYLARATEQPRTPAEGAQMILGAEEKGRPRPRRASGPRQSCREWRKWMGIEPTEDVAHAFHRI
ncbi:MAG: DUF5615 family PIN-like protein [Deltaproteobacteria bacterium]|nr:DUF5615 family PIN-like protein [Deltaproteobacteria bacterium]